MTTRRNSPADPWGTALRLLGRRDYSRTELSRKLAERNVSADVITEVMDRCQDLGYLDDRRYAELRARSLLRQGRAVGRRLLADLKQRGIDEATARLAIDQAQAELSEDRVLADLAARRFASFDYATAPPAERRRVIQFFQRRGFPLARVLAYFTEKGSQ